MDREGLGIVARPRTRVTVSVTSVSYVSKVGLIAGTLDITDALVWNSLHGTAPTRVLQYIASGLLGPRSFKLGLTSAALGVAIHYTIAMTWTSVLYIGSRRWTAIVARPVIAGSVYGVGVYLIMNFVVLPLAHMAPRNPPTLASRANGVLALVVCIGVVPALLFRRYLAKASV